MKKTLLLMTLISGMIIQKIDAYFSWATYCATLGGICLMSSEVKNKGEGKIGTTIVAVGLTSLFLNRLFSVTAEERLLNNTALVACALALSIDPIHKKMTALPNPRPKTVPAPRLWTLSKEEADKIRPQLNS